MRYRVYKNSLFFHFYHICRLLTKSKTIQYGILQSSMTNKHILATDINKHFLLFSVFVQQIHLLSIILNVQLRH